MTTTGVLPQASLREAWTVATVERWATAMGRPTAALRPGLGRGASAQRPARPADAALTRRRTEALLRLALDGSATTAERALAAERAAAYLRAAV
jgi:hypothetical protein